MTLDRPCDRCNTPEADVGWDNETLCLPCFLTDLHGRQLAARAAIARRQPAARGQRPRTFDPAPVVYRSKNSHHYHRPGPDVYGRGVQSACGKVAFDNVDDSDAEPAMAQRARPCGLCFPYAEVRHRTLLSVGAPT